MLGGLQRSLCFLSFLYMIEFVVFAAIFYVLPVLLIHTGVVPIHARLWLLAGVGILATYYSIWMLGWEMISVPVYSLPDARAFFEYGVFTALSAAALSVIASIKRPLPYEKESFYTFLPLAVLLSFLQQFLFQLLLLQYALTVLAPLSAVLVTAALFAIMHSIYPRALLGVPLAFFGGVGFAYLFVLHESFILAGISHTLLNITAVLLGFFVYKSKE